MMGHVSGALLVIAVCLQQAALAANILAIFSYCSASSFLFLTPYMTALVQKGHQLTIISAGNKYLADIDGARHIRVNALDHLMAGEQ